MLELFIKDLVVEGKHGVHAREKATPQRFKITVHIYITGTEPHKSDKLEDTVDWSVYRKKIIAIVQNTSFNLMERLAQEIANEFLKDKRIKKLIVNIDKIDAFLSGIPSVTLTTEAKDMPRASTPPTLNEVR